MRAKQIFLVGVALTREHLGILAESDFLSTETSTTLAEAHNALCNARGETVRADILLVNIHERLVGDDAEMIRALRDKQPATKMVVLGGPLSLALLWQAYLTRIHGYLLHAVPPDMLMHALDLVLSGQRILPPCLPAARSERCGTPEVPSVASAPNGLSAREAQILQQLVKGSSNKAIARDLDISHETVKVHIRALLRKLEARNRTQAALWGIEHAFDQSTVPWQRTEMVQRDDRLSVAEHSCEVAGHCSASAASPL
jgi:two-component system, NarL family, nitrate/nitrite response regulator NarL